jgi:ferric-dicitrate binding protein FerR (iron transport regulator)
MLRDGTKIILAPQTTLTVASTFGRDTRTVTLSGEAYFDVRTVAGAPFIVRTGTVATRVLGTAFSVRRYGSDDTVHVAVLSGKVASGGRSAPITVAAGTVAHVTDSTATATAVDDVRAYTDWTQGRLVFDETPVPAMLAALGRWYGYEFRLQDSVLASQNVSASFNVSDSKEMMIVLQGVLRVSMSFRGKVVTLTPRRETHALPSIRMHKSVLKPSMEVGR